jgi:aminoglycoside 3-N-acetyltransferase
MSVLSKIPRNYKVGLKAKILEARRLYVRAFLSYDARQLIDCLRSLGVHSGDSVMLHSAFGPHYGFRGTIEQLTDVFIDAVGPEGNLLMVSLPYRTSSLQYLSKLKTFDVRKTPSMMGLVSEYFRHRDDVLRSLHPTHPVLVHGARAEWFIAGHELCKYPCGPATPFEKLEQVDGKAVFFNVPFATFTFFHYLEHRVSPDMPFPLYTEQPFTVPVINRNGESATVTTFVFSQEAIRRRRFPVLENELRRRRLIKESRVGNSRVALIRVREAVECAQDMCRKGQYFYELSGLSESSGRSPNASREA